MNNDLEELIPSSKEIEDYFDRLWPICRSLTGDGLRQSFSILNKVIPLKIQETPSGTKVFDWEIPKEWNIKDSYILTPNGDKIADFHKNNLHIVGYSTPINQEVSKQELEEHLYSLPKCPKAIPYVTSYYKENWGFCLSHEQRKKLPEGNYQVVIESSLKDGFLTTGEALLQANSPTISQEILISSYLCHPSMANNELSGPLLLTFLYKALEKIPDRRVNYRFAIVPETIGAISYLHQHGKHLKENCIGGLVATCCGTKDKLNYKKSRYGDYPIDKIAENILRYGDHGEFSIREFFPTGSDERQYCSPGFNLPIGSLMRSVYGEYEEYHTSMDDKNIICFETLRNTIKVYIEIFTSLENHFLLERTSPYCEPQLGKRGLYKNTNFKLNNMNEQTVFLWILAYSDGKHSLVDIANKMKVSVYKLIPPLKTLIQHELIRDANG